MIAAIKLAAELSTRAGENSRAVEVKKQMPTTETEPPTNDSNEKRRILVADDDPAILR